MIIKLELPKDKKGNITSAVSEYNPSKDAKDRTKMVMDAFTRSDLIMSQSYEEFNNRSLIEEMNVNQRGFNTFQPPKSEDPDDAWKSNAVRPIQRNKVISIAAHLTGAVMFPKVYAQNENDEEDRDAGMVMRDLMEWAADRSNYDETFLFGIISALVNPAVIINTEFCESYRTIKEERDDGSWDKKQVLDEVLSGFQDSIVPLDELYISDIYENNIQKQSYLIRRRAIDYGIAEKKYGNNNKFRSYVRPGIQIMFDEETATFYEQYDESLQEHLVEEVIYYSRVEDLQLVFVNGVLLTDPDQPNPRRDKMYPFAKSGYEPIDEGKFFYYKSLVNKLAPDADVIDTLYQMIINGTYLQLMPPQAVFGDEAINSSVVAPGVITNFKETTKIQKIDAGNDLRAGESTLNRAEDSVNESSQDPRQSGQAVKGNTTAYEVSRLEQNARTMLGLTGKMIGFLVKQFGELRISDILQYMTVGEVMETTNGLKFKTFLLPDKTVDGRNKTRKIIMDGNMEEMNENQRKDKEYELLEKEGGMEGDTQIFLVNPSIFRRRKFLTKVIPEMILPKDDNIQKLLNLEEYDRAIQNPYANQEALLRDLLLGSFDKTKEEPDKYIRSDMGQAMGMAGAGGGTPLQKSIPNLTGEMPTKL